MTPPKRRGRPRLDPTDETVDITIRMPARSYIAACERAKHARVTVPELFRRELDPATRRGINGAKN